MEDDLLLSEESLTEAIAEIKEHLRDAERKRGRFRVEVQKNTKLSKATHFYFYPFFPLLSFLFRLPTLFVLE